jgi:hypothetical protein
MAADTAVVRGHPSRRVASATLLRMRMGEDCDLSDLILRSALFARVSTDETILPHGSRNP